MSTLLFCESHEWVKIEDNIATVGISDFAQAELGDITYIDLPSLGTALEQGKEFASIESVKAASDIYAPVNGEIIEVNSNLEASPELVNSSPYADGWLVKVKVSDAPQGLLSEEEYKSKCVH